MFMKIKVYILPLRNENVQLDKSWGDLRVYILPLRNENQKRREFFISHLSCLYPTFKEWKLKRWWSIQAINLRLYPTFKEWKLYLLAIFFVRMYNVYILPLRNENVKGARIKNYLFCLYPTFKEWKRLWWSWKCGGSA